jgi:hypothetical protein
MGAPGMPPEGLKIADVTPSFWPALSYGGPIESSLQLCRHLAAAGAEVRGLTTNSNGREFIPDSIVHFTGPRLIISC